jgi:polysaccharide biosynthesis/export protein
MVYFQGRDQLSEPIARVKPVYKIRSGDILNVQIVTLDEKSSIMFNNDRSPQRTMQQGGGGIGNAQMFLWGYNVDENGFITMPVVGSVELAGKSLSEASEYINSRVAEYLIGATVLVKLVNFSVTVVGEVRNPGKFFIYDTEITIIDLLAATGEMTDFAKRDITVVRQSAEGSSFGKIDLNYATALQSEYFYLQPDDIVYIEPHPLKRAGISQFPISLIFSTLSFTLLVLNYFR